MKNLEEIIEVLVTSYNKNKYTDTISADDVKAEHHYTHLVFYTDTHYIGMYTQQSWLNVITEKIASVYTNALNEYMYHDVFIDIISEQEHKNFDRASHNRKNINQDIAEFIDEASEELLSMHDFIIKTEEVMRDRLKQ
ncbi:hypothetical protein [Vibrio harveyi]|uniref:hypothetical protein n=1 Tax=Vibrio harveyi TaxID=669 RepID=UPI001262B01A|nr:hypothetical protein [Vibrio harveyi]QFQ76880.1 hypothetical protein F9277_05130 [Vibrio harveyi]